MNFTLKNTGMDILKALAYIIDVEERKKLYHSWRVAYLTKCLAEEVCQESVLPLYVTGLLHDVGTFDLSNRLIHHKDQMEDVDVADVRIHPQKGAAIVASLPGFIPIAKIILDHHEWISGEGYPRGLKGEEISLESQIIKTADKFAFLADITPVTEISDIEKALKDRVGREFSKELYECLMDKLRSESGLWESIVDEKKLSELTERSFAQIPVEKDEDLIINRNLLHFFGRVLDAKHSYTEGHSQRVSYFSVIIALALGLPDEKVRKIELAAFLHDIGKVGIPKSILDKRGPLTPEEFEIIRKHASLSYEIVKGISAFEKLAYIVGADQEHWDGSGYPEGLKKEEIPIESRIIFIADAFDAMTSNRSYRKAISVEDAINELKKSAGREFDPEIVNIACDIFEGFKNSSIIACYSNINHDG
jgi:HD-GYP domain-containing protein (c-di-GMP phosphodiesterase class II)